MMMVCLRELLEGLLNPYFLSLLLLVFAVLLCCLKKGKRFVRIGLLLSLFGFLLCSTPWFPNALINHLEKQYPVVNTINPDMAWIVILGGGHDDRGNVPANDELSSASIVRLVEGARLHRLLPRAKLVLSGGCGHVGNISEASYLATLASWLSIPTHLVILEDHSVNTADEALAIKKIVHDDPFYLVTSATHMPRAMFLFKQQGLNPIASPTDFTHDHRRAEYIPNGYNLAHTQTAWHEILGICWAKLHGSV